MTGSAPLPQPHISVYRDHCIALLRRYFCMAVEVGRLPAILGREFFRARTRDYHVHSFENLVVFVIDVERCLNRLHPFDRKLIARIVLQEYTDEEAARLLHCGLRTIERRLPEALDFLTQIFLDHGMLNLNQRVRVNRSIDVEEPRCSNHVPQRATFRQANRAVGTDSRFETSLVKPPISPISLQAAAAQENIILADVAGLPPPICYAGFVS